MPKEIRKTKASVCIVESLGFLEESTHREGEIISRTLRLSGKKASYVNLRTLKELRAFAEEFGASCHRYLHISCHGNKGRFFTTTGDIAAGKFAELLAPHLQRRRLFLSACLAAEGEFAAKLLLASGCRSVLAPTGEIDFDDAAIFWTSFYHLMFKKNRKSMTKSAMEETVRKCAELVDQKFRLFYRDGDVVRSTLIG